MSKYTSETCLEIYFTFKELEQKYLSIRRDAIDRFNACPCPRSMEYLFIIDIKCQECALYLEAVEQRLLPECRTILESMDLDQLISPA